jgi:hypothetical protein
MDVDVEENGTVVGQYLRVKVRIDIRKPLMRGVTMEVEDEESTERWCPFVYEFLPEFFHCCGIIDRMDRICKRVSPTGAKQYGSWLQALPPNHRFSLEKGSGGFGGQWGVQHKMDHSNGD